MGFNYLYRWNGSYFGFISGGYVFDSNCHYLGWIESDGKVWYKNGEFWGEIVDTNYILRRSTQVTLTRLTSHATPATPAVPPIPAIRAVRASRAGWEDALA